MPSHKRGISPDPDGEDDPQVIEIATEPCFDEERDPQVIAITTENRKRRKIELEHFSIENGGGTGVQGQNFLTCAPQITYISSALVSYIQMKMLTWTTTSFNRLLSTEAP
jgi:hypothetical protein